MGNSGLNENYVYAEAESAPQRPGETPVFRHPLSKGKDLWKEYGGKTISALYRQRFDERPDAVGFARRLFDKATKQHTNEVEEITNRQFQEMAEHIGSGLTNLGLVKETNEWNNLSLKFVGVYAKNSLEYLVLDTACVFYGMTIIPIYDTLGEEATRFAFDQTGMEVCFMTTNHLEGIIKLKKKGGFGKLGNVVVMDSYALTPALEASAKEQDLRLLRWEEVIEAGKKQPHPWAKVDPKSIAAFSYTSGTTGTPKGAMMSHENLSTMAQTLIYICKPTVDDVYLNYLPMAHVMEKSIITACVVGNITVCFYSGDVAKIKDDLAIFRPTLFVSVPRLYNRFYDTILQTSKGLGGLKKLIFNMAVNSKSKGLKSDCSYNSNVYDSLVFNKMKAVMGGRVRLMVSGSAPISKEVLDFLKIAFCAPLLEGYGQTEGTALEFITRDDDPEAGHVGGPGLANEFKLVDIPEMNYTSQDVDAQGNPTPRGEILVRGPNIIPGYYKLDEKNKEAFTEDGWLMSGDVGMVYSDKRRLKIIDRKKNIFKLAQGEYIAPEKLENAYKHAHPSVSAVYVHGDPLQSYLVGVVNIEGKQLVGMAREFGIEGEDPDKLANDPAMKKKVIGLFDDIAKEKKFNSLEKLKDIVIEPKSFQEMGLLTEAFKVKRVDTRDKYKKAFDDMYAKGL